MRNEPHAEVIADSISPEGNRLTTMVVTFHRFVLAEFNTHRTFCLAGDTQLEFDLPAGCEGGAFKRAHYVRLDDFVSRWEFGAERYAANPKRDLDLSALDPEQWYYAEVLSDMLRYSKSAIHAKCREGVLDAKKSHEGGWLVSGRSFIEWRNSKPTHTRFPVRDRLRGMKIRQLDESDGTIQSSVVTNAFRSGVKPVYVLRAGDFSIAASMNHLVMTNVGYKKLGEIVPGEDSVMVKRFGKKPSERQDPNKWKFVDGVWRNNWQEKYRQAALDRGEGCSECGTVENLHVHHIIPVHVDPSLTYDPSNVQLLCPEHHNDQHSEQGWQGGTYLYGDLELVDSVEFRGLEETYDLEIAGEFPNFLANGIVVHNSRSSASSRAIPVAKQLQRVDKHRAFPIEWRGEQRGMQGGDELDGADLLHAQRLFDEVHESTLELVNQYLIEADYEVYGTLHKSLINRLLEPFMWHTVIVASTEWDNFFKQRCSPLAQPEIRVAAELMRDALAASEPIERPFGGYIKDMLHLPFIKDEEREAWDWERSARVSVARCARVSYLNHDGEYDTEGNEDLYYKLIDADPPHWAPLEMVATPCGEWMEFCGGNFKGWNQLRHNDHLLEDVNADPRNEF